MDLFDAGYCDVPKYWLQPVGSKSAWLLQDYNATPIHTAEELVALLKGWC